MIPDGIMLFQLFSDFEAAILGPEQASFRVKKFLEQGFFWSGLPYKK
jgi:hypothetical protein